MSEEDNIQKIEAQKQVEEKSSNSNVKTPLVDALYRYFLAEDIAKGIVETDKARIQNMVNSCYSNG